MIRRVGIFVVLVWMATLVSVASAKPPQAAVPKTFDQYSALFLNGKKIGYEHTTRAVDSQRVRTQSDTKMTIRRGSMQVQMRVYMVSVETFGGQPLEFEFVQDLGLMKTQISGKIQGKMLVVTTKSGGKTQTRNTAWPKDALLSWGVDRFMQIQGLERGTEYTCRMFNPDSLNASVVKTTVGYVQQVDLLGRVMELTELQQVTTVSGSSVRGTTFVDEDVRPYKQLTNMMGMEMTAVACDEAFAKSPSETIDDFLKAVSIQAPAGVSNLREVSKAVYSIAPTAGGAELHFLDQAGQSVRKTNVGLEITVAAPAVPVGAMYPYAGSDAELRKALESTTYLQADASEIRDMLRQALGATPPTDAAQAAQRITAYVREYITTKDLSVGYASAVEVARSKQGDCTEHAVLTAALLRAAGIPAKVVAGVAYVDQWMDQTNVFLPHAWVIAYIGDTWAPYDAALGRFDPGHLAMVAGDGSLSDYVGVVNTLGNFWITNIKTEE